ncbi:MARVEL domain-containing protein 3 isoform X2 [Acomys russatus]|uniref:MARVEL domain-containing protein 3 isoform X2 n=1 Tax=Acomys russatus TaxID=60746 RepID=UPI0021E34183|nr:MARVEL domain-containing protein 3 isoform X2 [Acomys russatus]
MEDTSGTREPRARPRERDRDRRPHPDRDRHVERPRDRDRDRHRERNGDTRGNGDRRAGRDPRTDRDPLQDRHRDAGHRAAEQRAWEKSRQSRARPEPWVPSWDSAPTPGPAPWGPPEPPRKQGLGRRGLESELPSERYVPTHSGPPRQEEDYYPSEAEGILECHKCRYLCTGRACCQMLEVLLNLLILACSSVSYSSTGGYTGITSLGGIYYYHYGGAYSGFSGADGEKAQQLDVHFYQLKLPTVTAAMAYSGALMTFSCLLLLGGVLRVPWHCPLWLVIEGLMDALIAGAYIPALYFFFQHLSAAYSSDVCKEREALYQSKGYSGFSCGVHGGDVGAGVFAAMGIGVFAVGAVLALRGYRKVKKLKEKPTAMLEF